MKKLNLINSSNNLKEKEADKTTGGQKSKFYG
jgi:hypothetical protein